MNKAMAKHSDVPKTIGCTLFLILILLVLGVSLCGCATKQAVQNLQGKSMVGDGFVAVSKICISDPSAEDYTPMIKTVVVSGKLMTILKDANLLNYTRNSSSSIWNASSVTTQETLTISVPPGKNIGDILKEFTKLSDANSVVKTEEKTEAKKE